MRDTIGASGGANCQVIAQDAALDARIKSGHDGEVQHRLRQPSLAAMAGEESRRDEKVQSPHPRSSLRTWSGKGTPAPPTSWPGVTRPSTAGPGAALDGRIGSGHDRGGAAWSVPLAAMAGNGPRMTGEGQRVSTLNRHGRALTGVTRPSTAGAAVTKRRETGRAPFPRLPLLAAPAPRSAAGPYGVCFALPPAPAGPNRRAAVPGWVFRSVRVSARSSSSPTVGDRT